MKKDSQKVLLILLVVTIFIFLSYRVLKTNSNPSLKDIPTIDEENKVKQETQYLKAKLEINNTIYDVSLYENETTKELITRLPLEINMRDLNNNEKYYYFESSLPTTITSPITINVGDIMLYGNNCLVIFYETFITNYAYTKIGKIENTDSLKQNLGNSSVTIKIVFN